MRAPETLVIGRTAKEAGQLADALGLLGAGAYPVGVGGALYGVRFERAVIHAALRGDARTIKEHEWFTCSVACRLNVDADIVYAEVSEWQQRPPTPDRSTL